LQADDVNASPENTSRPALFGLVVSGAALTSAAQAAIDGRVLSAFVPFVQEVLS
jgi:hypothetical protein